jgi:hypothetical protein
MSDPGSVATAYAIVVGGLALYVASIVRRVHAARRTAQALERERARDRRDTAASSRAAPAVRPEEVPR